jgi:hypothetical protein
MMPPCPSGASGAKTGKTKPLAAPLSAHKLRKQSQIIEVNQGLCGWSRSECAIADITKRAALAGPQAIIRRASAALRNGGIAKTNPFAPTEKGSLGADVGLRM